MKRSFQLLIVIAIIVIKNIAFANLNDGLVAYYPFNGNANDESGNGNHGTVKGNVIFKEGIIGKTGVFEGGSGDYIVVPSSTSLSVTDSVSMCAWVNPSNLNLYSCGSSSSGCNPIIVKGDTKDFYSLWLLSHGLSAVFNQGTNEFLVPYTAETITENSWYFIAATYDGQNVKYYINGEIKNTYTYASPINTSEEPLYIGANYGFNDEFFSGRIDEVRIYSRALSESEIKLLAVIGDDYLEEYKNANCPDCINECCGPDKWGFCINNCTSFVAWRMNRDGGEGTFTNTMNGGYWGDAANWDDNAAQLGILVNSVPKEGSIAQWNKNEIGGKYGHVAYVESVGDDETITISEYNYGNACGYGERTINRADIPRYIHVFNKDSDGDGVIDQWDQCSDTPYDSAVSSNGCPVLKGDIDNDRKIGLSDCIRILQILTQKDN